MDHHLQIATLPDCVIASEPRRPISPQSCLRSVNLQIRTLFSPRLTTRALMLTGCALPFLLANYSPTVRAQGFGVESNSPPTVVGAGTFVSLEGRFSLALPHDKHGFRPLAIATPIGNATGDAYDWMMKEGLFTAGYVDAAEPWDDPETSKRVFASLRESMDKFASANSGKLVSEKSIELNKHPGVEMKFEFFTGLMIQRMYLSSHRLYQIVLVVKDEQRVYEGIAVNVLDSFKILSEVEAATARKEQAAEAEPSPLPQEPVVSRIRSDADDEGLRERVKTVFTESEDLSGTWSVQGRKPNSMDYYNERGNLTKRESYDYKGNLSEITVYGYLDGARVSDWKTIRREYNPPPMMISLPPGETKPKYDPRYKTKYTYQYDDKNRLAEKTIFGNEGKVRIRYVYKYAGNQREDLAYSADGSLNQRYLSILDSKGNAVEKTFFEPRDKSIRSKNSYVYEFDSNGNWTKRTSSKWVTKDGSSSYQPESVYYQTITYYK
jgi:hypothetical protein